jgi:IS30 family transposase
MGQDRYRHLWFEEREQVAIRRLEGVSQAEMARRLGRSSSTINHELARKGLPLGGYQRRFAEGSYLARRERLALLERDERLARFVVDRLTEGLAPEEIAARHGLLTMAASQMDRAAFWRALAQGRQRARSVRDWPIPRRKGDHLFLHLSGATEGRKALEAAAPRQGQTRPAQAP